MSGLDSTITPLIDPPSTAPRIMSTPVRRQDEGNLQLPVGNRDCISSNVQITEALLQPAISNLLGTNAVPTSAQAIESRALIATYTEQLGRIEQRSDLMNHSDIVADLLPKLQETIDDLKALISPARALIPEVLSTIFEFCVSTQGRLPTPDPGKAPLLLVQICANWRRVALATPKVSLILLFTVNLTVHLRSGDLFSFNQP